MIKLYIHVHCILKAIGVVQGYIQVLMLMIIKLWTKSQVLWNLRVVYSYTLLNKIDIKETDKTYKKVCWSLFWVYPNTHIRIRILWQYAPLCISSITVRDRREINGRQISVKNYVIWINVTLLIAFRIMINLNKSSRALILTILTRNFIQI